MSTRHSSELNSPSAMLQRLCCKVTGLSDDAVLPHYQFALRILGSNFAPPIESDEFQVSEKIKRQLVRKGREKMQRSSLNYIGSFKHNGLKNRWAILYLLMSLSDNGAKSGNKSAFSSSVFGQNLSTYATSTPFHPAARVGRDAPRVGQHTPGMGVSGVHSTSHSTASSGISSIHSGRSEGPTPVPQTYIPSYLATPAHNPADVDRTGRGLGGRLAQSFSKTRDADLSLVTKNRGVPTSITIHRGDNKSFEIPEAELLKDLIYAFQGIEGSWIKFDSSREGYRIDPTAGIPKAVRQLISKLAECGWLYNKIKAYVETRSSDKAFGLVGQSFCAALHHEMTEFYRLIAVLEAQLQQEQDEGFSESQPGLTLRRLMVWTFDPLVRLKSLAALVDVCKGKKGGALASSIYSYMQHGDPYIRALIKHTLTMVSQPIYATLLRWIYDGELEDTYHEFFVASDPTVKNDLLWYDKYSLRKSMIPTFVTTEQARKILLTGKSINFLRQVCQDRTPTKGREVAMTFDVQKAECMLTQDTGTEFQLMVDTVYKDTSQHLLDVFNNQYKFLDHLKAMRRYLLLGQGDFIRHLMDLLEEDLAKPASNLYLHNLTGILETAIRATNAQFDDSDILKRLDVRLLEVSPGDTGWDVFSLDYHVDGPIRTVFTPQCVIMYLRVFNFLWRAKRMEYILAIIWKNQMTFARQLRTIPELKGILHQCHALGCEMVHFIQQAQYYINFEVLECSWDELLTKVQEAEDLDYIIAAHQVFLDTIVSRCLLDDKSRAILTQLRTIFDLIIQFQAAQENFYQAANSEMDAREHFKRRLKARTAEGEWGVTEAEEEEEKQRQNDFLKNIIPSTRAQLIVLAQSYQDMVQQFLVMLTSHQDVSLRFLSFRLDFNEHYKAREPKLKSPLAYQKVKRAR